MDEWMSGTVLLLDDGVDAGQGSGDLSEEGLHVVARLGRRFYEHCPELLRLRLALLRRHTPAAEGSGSAIRGASSSSPNAPRSSASGAAAVEVRGVPLIGEIGFVAHEHEDDVVAALGSDVLHPPRRIQERRPV